MNTDFTRSNLSPDEQGALEPHISQALKQAYGLDLDLSACTVIEVVDDIVQRIFELHQKRHDDDPNTWAFAYPHDDGTSRVILSDQSAKEIIKGCAVGSSKLLHELAHIDQFKNLGPLHFDDATPNHVRSARMYWQEYHANLVGLTILSDVDAQTYFQMRRTSPVTRMMREPCGPLTLEQQRCADRSFPIEQITNSLVYAFGVLDSRQPKVREAWEKQMWKDIRTASQTWWLYSKETLHTLRDVKPFSEAMFRDLEAHLVKWVYPHPIYLKP